MSTDIDCDGALGGAPVSLEFSENARQAVDRAWEEAVALGHSYVGPEHLLLGLLKEESSVAVSILNGLGADRRSIEHELREEMEPRSDRSGGERPFTPRAKRALKHAMSEALAFGRQEVDSEHLLLGLLIEEANIAKNVLADSGVNLEKARKEALRLLDLRPEDVGPVTRSWPEPAALHAGSLGNLLHSYRSHLPPLSDTGRKVRRILLWGTPVLIFAAIPCASLFPNQPGAPPRGIQILMAIYVFPALAWLLFLAFFRLQAHILELLLILPACSLPAGLALNMTGTDESIRWLVGTVGLILLAGGSVWGLSIAQRSGERRTWPRLGLLALGWCLCPGMVAFFAIVLSLAARDGILTSAWHYILATVLVLGAIVGLVIEWRCHRRYGPMRVW